MFWLPPTRVENTWDFSKLHVLWSFENMGGHFFPNTSRFVSCFNMDISGFWVGPIFKHNILRPFKWAHNQSKPDISCLLAAVGRHTMAKKSEMGFPTLFIHLSGILYHRYSFQGAVWFDFVLVASSVIELVFDLLVALTGTNLTIAHPSKQAKPYEKHYILFVQPPEQMPQKSRTCQEDFSY